MADRGPALDCARARDLLRPLERPRLAGDEVLRARAHLEACPACRAFFAQDRFLLDAYARLRAVRTPPRLRERVLERLALEGDAARSDPADAPRTPPSGRSDSGTRRPFPPGAGWRAWIRDPRSLAMVATVLLLLVGGALWELRSGDPRAEAVVEHRGPGVFLDDYLRRAVGEDRITTADPMEVAEFIARELGAPLPPVRFTGLILTGAEVCLVEGKRGALVRYEREGRRIVHYMIPLEGAERRAPAPSDRGSEALEEGMPSVVTWASPSVEHALVGSMPSGELMAIALSGIEAR